MDNFAREFMVHLNGKVPDSVMNVIFNELELYSTNYEIHKRGTAIAEYSPQIPICYESYMIAKKIEGLSKETLKTYHLCLKHFFYNINKSIEQLTANDIRGYLYNYQRIHNISNRTLDGFRLIINTFLEWCFEEGYIAKNPCKQIRPIKYEAIELELVRDACKDYREKAIVEVFYSTGCRVSEMVNLKISDINFVTGEVHLFGKGNKHRTSYLNAKAEVALKKYLKNQRMGDSDNLFVSSRKPYDGLKKPALELIVRNIGKRADIGRNVYPHLIRHTTATDALNRGMNVVEVQKILGHEKLDTTMIYAKISQDSVKFNHKLYVV